MAWRIFVEVTNAALRDFHRRVTVEIGDDARPDAIIGGSQTTLYSVAMLQLVNDLAEEVPYLKCANEACGRLFARQRGRTKYATAATGCAESSTARTLALGRSTSGRSGAVTGQRETGLRVGKRANGEGGIYRRASDGRWVGALTLADQGRRRRHVVYGKLRREVAAKLEEARQRLAADEPVKDARATVAAFVEDWITQGAASIRAEADHARELRDHCPDPSRPAPFGALTLDRLRPSDIEALLVAKRDAGLSDSTVRLIYTVCRAVLDIAVRDGIVRRNVAAAVKRPTIKRSEARYLTARGGRAAPRSC